MTEWERILIGSACAVIIYLLFSIARGIERLINEIKKTK